MVGSGQTGRCECGCGSTTAIIKRTQKARGRIKGQHSRFAPGHGRRIPEALRAAPPNPDGLCMCGCGRETEIATTTRSENGDVAGHPRRYIVGHNTKVFKPIRFLEEDRGYETPCHVWQLRKNERGYGQVQIGRGKCAIAHRVYWEEANGPAPDGHHLHHLCGVRDCVNPEHLEPIEPGEHRRRHLREAENGD